MQHPFERWFAASLRPLFAASLVLSSIVMVALASVDAGLHVPSAPRGIASFEITAVDRVQLAVAYGGGPRGTCPDCTVPTATTLVDLVR